ncbi:hypothetical protein PHYPSEUDO_007294 [Phytophthora pseudosyringae]|uniref:PX domain-containing protein n=1 Tax=Phytophthora pseudosyringae TaxID=221518 RepID=A0A8T1VGE6_9STRA|nr:hypothetical protein PHYPSEUDO_007294 [Phytophthora pseudosyringae]
MAATCRASETTTGLHPKLLAPVSPSGDPLTPASFSPTSSIAAEGVQPHLGLKLEAHRRWNASLPVGLLWSVERVEINVTRSDVDNGLVFVLEVFLSLPSSRLPVSKPSSNEERVSAAAAARPTFRVERRFSDFEELRRSVSSCVSMERQCSCQYCLAFVEYIRFSATQPRGLVKRFAGEHKRKQVLQTFINDFVAMGQRRVVKTGKRKCQAQQLVPNVLGEFLLQGAMH